MSVGRSVVWKKPRVNAGGRCGSCRVVGPDGRLAPQLQTFCDVDVERWWPE